MATAMGVRIDRLQDRQEALKVAGVTIQERVYLDREGKATTDESQADRLWATPGTEVTQEEIERVGYSGNTAEPRDADADARAAREARVHPQTLVARGLDPSTATEEEIARVTGPLSTQAAREAATAPAPAPAPESTPTEEEVSYRDLQARAKALGLPASGSREEIEARIADAEKQD